MITGNSLILITAYRTHSQETLPALARICKEQLIFTKYAELDYETLLELIMNEANLKLYLPSEEFRDKERLKPKFRVWEWKDERTLGLVADLKEADRIRKLRIATKKILGRLLRIIDQFQDVPLTLYFMKKFNVSLSRSKA